jgi:hypothetical protein
LFKHHKNMQLWVIWTFYHIVSINKLTLTLKIIGQYDVTCIMMTLLIKTTMLVSKRVIVV